MKHVGCSVSHTGSDAFSHALRRILFQPIPENAVSFSGKKTSVLQVVNMWKNVTLFPLAVGFIWIFCAETC